VGVFVNEKKKFTKDQVEERKEERAKGLLDAGKQPETLEEGRARKKTGKCGGAEKGWPGGKTMRGKTEPPNSSVPETRSAKKGERTSSVQS